MRLRIAYIREQKWRIQAKNGESKASITPCSLLALPGAGTHKTHAQTSRASQQCRFPSHLHQHPHIHHRLLPSIDTNAFHRRFPNFHFLSVPDDLPPLHLRNFLDIFPSIRSAIVAALRQLLVSDLNRTTTCIIAGGIMSSSAVTAGDEFGIPVLTFRTFSACYTWTYFHLSKFVEEGEVPLQGTDMDKLLTCTPGLENALRR
ncbi:hypothetical protein F3Y22_tig00111403pilonHSYRG00033 [Hibiscus syriacus]|uniref:Uncharacterized protein n=1 Tax=Hibiscus syriacus TaxID=106335 RepID=A0A6A2Y8Y2_HIBSY|nr:hypothetical protein F3Y22_tig00111403pilonHSYRG00033 [Hibiscus syriacus]